jgi:predicted nucleic acid-binding protein
MRNKEELRLLRKTLAIWNISPLVIDEQISRCAAYYVEEFFLSHALRLADALIAATAVEQAIPLATANAKHYQVITELNLIIFKP